jgi:hypothetical protein
MSLGKKKMQMQGAAGVVPSENFNTVLWTGNGASRSITGVGFQPDLIWIKKRSSATNAQHMLFDVVRGVDKVIRADDAAAEYDGTGTGYHTSFDSDGFGLTSNAFVNQSSQTYVAWNFKAGGAAVSNTDGTITTSVSANPDAGFSICAWSGTGTNGQSWGHGLNQAPELVLFKKRNAATNWYVWAKESGGTLKRFEGLNTTNAAVTSGLVTTLGASTVTHSNYSSDFNNSGTNYIAYCFHSVAGYQKVGSYTGTGTANNKITLDFQPRFLMVKNATDANDWIVVDAARSTSNPRNEALHWNTSNAEYANDTYYTFDFLSDGFDCNNTSGSTNASGKTYIYLAIA